MRTARPLTPKCPKCCVIKTCRPSDGATCANGECCDATNCRLYGGDNRNTTLPLQAELPVLSRFLNKDCDAAEYCDGKQSSCPTDTRAPRDSPCNSDLGHQAIVTRKMQRPKRQAWRSSASPQSATALCLRQESRGKSDGHCARESPPLPMCFW